VRLSQEKEKQTKPKQKQQQIPNKTKPKTNHPNKTPNTLWAEESQTPGKTSCFAAGYYIW
jgi:hypothetical protein